MTSQVTTQSCRTRHDQPSPDDTRHLTSYNTTNPNYSRRTRQAWHARGQGFESPKLHNDFIIFVRLEVLIFWHLGSWVFDRCSLACRVIGVAPTRQSGVFG